MTSAKPECVADFLGLLNRPSAVARKLTLPQWDLIVRQARSVGMLGRLHSLLSAVDAIEWVPEAALRHLRWGAVISRRHANLVNIEVNGIAHLLSSLKGPVVLLKGAAYSYGEIKALKGRIFTDIDLLIDENEIDSTETLLERSGWLSSHMSDYDQRYYRRWMHELPPMKHGQRQTELDLHHAILPKTSRFKADTSLLLSNLVLLNPERRLYRLSDEDLLLHSSAHLFFDGEFKHGFRDLEDIRSMLSDWDLSESGWKSLLQRAAILGLSHPLYFSLYFSREWFDVEVPEWILSQAAADSGLGFARTQVLLKLFRNSLLPIHNSCGSWVNSLARYCLYVRSHYLRMPVKLLIPHLVYKGILPVIERVKERRKEHSKGGVLQRLVESKANGKVH